MFAERPDDFLRDFGTPCVAANGHTFTAIFDTPDDTLGMGGVSVQTTTRTLLAQTSDAHTARLAYGAAVRVAGAAYVVRQVELQDDGAFSLITLSQ